MRWLALLLVGCTSGPVLTVADASTITMCSGDEAALTRGAPPDLFIVLDRSSPALGPWDVVTQGFQQYFSSNTAGVKWGLLLVPHRNGGCTADPVDVPLASDAGAAIVSVVTDPFNQPVGELPLRDAIALAQSQLAAATDQNPRYLVIITASSAKCAATCSCPPGWTPSSTGGICYRPSDNYPQVCGSYDYAGSAQAVTTASTAGLHSFVIGVDVTDPGTLDGLDELARLGGEPVWANVSTAADLAAALGAIAGPLADCAWRLPRPAGASEIRITVDGLAVAHDPSHTNGWDLATDGTTVLFFGQWCTSLRSGMFQAVHARYGCPPIP
jgi:hypothetical protein